MKTKVQALSVLVFSLLATGTVADSVAENQGNVRCIPDDCLFNVDSLTTLDTHPFRLVNQVIGPEHVQWDNYRAAFRRYETAIDCLMPAQRSDQQVDLLMIDWERLHTNVASRICLWLIFSVLREREAIENWMRFHEFEIRPAFEAVPWRPGVPVEEQPSLVVAGVWTKDQYYQKFPTVAYRLFSFGLVTSFSVQVQFLPDGSVYNVTTIARSAFN